MDKTTTPRSLTATLNFQNPITLQHRLTTSKRSKLETASNEKSSQFLNAPYTTRESVDTHNRLLGPQLANQTIDSFEKF
jgi:hypothetical protein